MPDTRHLPFSQTLPDEVLADLIEKNYGIKPVTINSMGGYSNLNYNAKDGFRQDYVLRIARRNRTTDSLRAEQYVLTNLEHLGFDLAPRLVQAGQEGIPVINLDSLRFIQLSRMLPGAIDCLWWQQCSFGKLRQIFGALAQLHGLMARIGSPTSQQSPPFCYALPERPPPVLLGTPTGAYVFHQWLAFREAAMRLQQEILDRFPWERARYQWIHGDIQLENLLFEQDKFSGFLDFERVSIGACELDAIFSAFRVCKEGNSDGPFVYDQDRLAASIGAYQADRSGLCSLFFEEYEKYWKPFFCLDQAMVYLQNAFDGVWELAEGIGFMPCFNEVLHYPLSE
jgi:Ser/Thr protein kinase RdoA (MazF antagonist)